ncbi:hypothetical protein TNCV_827191 [Trichonephila clavipes]|nr:hypothetical protein TNCV_827191 [Trichonephila clavipes]
MCIAVLHGRSLVVLDSNSCQGQPRSLTTRLPWHLVFVEEAVKINQKVYRRDIIEAVVLLWDQKHFGNSSWMLQQDCTSLRSQKGTRVVQCEFSRHGII